MLKIQPIDGNSRARDRRDRITLFPQPRLPVTLGNESITDGSWQDVLRSSTKTGRSNDEHPAARVLDTLGGLASCDSVGLYPEVRPMCGRCASLVSRNCKAELPGHFQAVVRDLVVTVPQANGTSRDRTCQTGFPGMGPFGCAWRLDRTSMPWSPQANLLAMRQRSRSRCGGSGRSLTGREWSGRMIG